MDWFSRHVLDASYENEKAPVEDSGVVASE
jgi:hypothetical protein